MHKKISQLEKIQKKFLIKNLPLICLSAVANWGVCYVLAGGSWMPWAAFLVPFLVGAAQRSTDRSSYSWRISLAFLVVAPLFFLAGVMAYGFWVDGKSSENSANYVMFFAVIALVGVVQLLVYFIPSMIARKRSNFSKVFIVNLLAGWTVVGWFLALYLALKADSIRKDFATDNDQKEVS